MILHAVEQSIPHGLAFQWICLQWCIENRERYRNKRHVISHAHIFYPSQTVNAADHFYFLMIAICQSNMTTDSVHFAQRNVPQAEFSCVYCQKNAWLAFFLKKPLTKFGICCNIITVSYS